MLKIGDIRELIRLLDETSLSEIHLESEDVKLHLKKPEPEHTVTYAAPVQAAPAVAPQPVVQAAPAASGQAPAVTNERPAAANDEGTHVIVSPMVGTFYRSPSPDAPSFTEVGSVVNSKTVVCIVEAMKLMNEIEAEVNGEVVEVLAENGQLVEYGQPLFKIRLS
ncbi:acetyl-CoA carboxylase biotin carboxyl carrier protein [Alicyclobacillus dauci]|uniref:Biotin carboxyl carrier protein of acetyl-CoA carboxylase n=1 Tax=Alicyclobacillus dauci TaxID=1475485 RepID=A0ABY6Z8Z1_9BACL|nr:acetyl-CoA carboxylase biotin carboxyl carrier protein [Alicyclobacillus dauci]WAH39003.1 acetyl-CoA carboxylase biotin carboxyl carrier protein [Alicyclobacillus dauci]